MPPDELLRSVKHSRRHRHAFVRPPRPGVALISANLPVVAVGTVRLPDYIACANGRLSIDYRKWFWCAPARSRDEAMPERDESNPIARSSRSTHRSGVAKRVSLMGAPTSTLSIAKQGGD